MDAEQLKEIRERLGGTTPDMDFFVSLGGQAVANWPRGLWANEQVVNHDIRFHNAAYADMTALLAEVESLQKQLDQAKSRSRTWRDLYKSKRKFAYELIESIHKIALTVGLINGDSGAIEAAEATYKTLLNDVEVEDSMVETMEAIENVLIDPILRGQMPHD